MQLTEYLRQRRYPGRGICVGKAADGLHDVIVYFIMGRSENSRNRVFCQEGERLYTKAFDESRLSDPSLVIYNAIDAVDAPGGRCVVVTNGDQTDTVTQAMRTQLSMLRELQGAAISAEDEAILGDVTGQFYEALQTRRFEPDPPILTPRISGLICSGGFKLSILKSAGSPGLMGDPETDLRYFFEYTALPAGTGRFIHTYQEGPTPPSFDGEPVAVSLPVGDIQAQADSLWQSLDPENKVALCVQWLSQGQTQRVIVNKHKD